MIDYQDLLKFKESELQAHLEQHNRFVAPGGIVVYNNTLAEIYGRAKRYILIKNSNGDVQQVDISDAPLLTIDMFRRLKLYNRKKQIRGNFKYAVAILTRIACQVYGIERVDIITEERFRRISVVVHYPEIEITNTTGTKHTIKDLYIKHIFTTTENFGIKSEGQHAIKTTYSNGEVINSYLHSHISSSSRSPGQWSSSFCFGSTTFAQFVSNIRQRGEMTQSDIYQLFFGMDEYLKWESLEGTPFNRIGNIAEFRTEVYSVNYDSSLVDRAYKYIVQNIEDFQYTTTMRNNEVRVEITTSIEKILTEFLDENGRRDLVLRVHNGTPVRVHPFSRGEMHNNNGERLDFLFKGNRQVLKIDTERGSTEAIDRLHPLRVHPQFYIAVKVKLENKFETFLSEKQKQTQQTQDGPL